MVSEHVTTLHGYLFAPYAIGYLIYLGLRLYLFICMLSHTLLIYLTYWLVFIQLVIHGVRRPAGGPLLFVSLVTWLLICMALIQLLPSSRGCAGW